MSDILELQRQINLSKALQTYLLRERIAELENQPQPQFRAGAAPSKHPHYAGWTAEQDARERNQSLLA